MGISGYPVREFAISSQQFSENVYKAVTIQPGKNKQEESALPGIFSKCSKFCVVSNS